MEKCPYCELNPFGIPGCSAVDCCLYGFYLFGLGISREIVDEAFKTQTKIDITPYKPKPTQSKQP